MWKSLKSMRSAGLAGLLFACAIGLAACCGAPVCSGCVNNCGVAPVCAAPSGDPAACTPCSTACALPCDRPPNAQPGEAWCRIWIPPEHKTVTETVCTKPAVKRVVRIPAEYGSRPKLVCCQPAKVRQVVRPAVWTQREKSVMVCPERSCFRRVCCEQGNLNEGEIQCECWMKQRCPPVFRTCCEPVCVSPPVREVRFTPAQYKTVPERYCIRPARCETVCEPAQFKEVSRQVCCRPGRWVWRRNPDCEVPKEKLLPALEVEMVDSLPDGTEEGVFAQGSTVRYNLTVRSDVGSEAMPNLVVKFSLPAELEFISGSGDGVTVTGSAHEAQSSVFPLALGQEVKLHILAKVVAVPPTSFVQMTASVQTESGDELAKETESTTLTDGSK